MSELDIENNRAARKYGVATQLARVAWAVGRMVFRLVPRPLHAPRRLILRVFGARLGQGVQIANTAVVYFPWNLVVGDWSAVGERALIYNLGPVRIGEKVTISQGAHLCAGTHDFRDPAMPLMTPPINVESQAWICADAFVGPGVTVGEGAVVGARAVAMKNVSPWSVVAGNPAVAIRQRALRGAGEE